MIVELPSLKKEMRDGKLVKIEGIFKVNLDMSMAAEMRFETNFPQLAEREDLFNYSKRINEIEVLSTGVIISKMKLLYCWFDTEISFIEFLKMFDLSDREYIEKLTSALQNAFEVILESSCEKN